MRNLCRFLFFAESLTKFSGEFSKSAKEETKNTTPLPPLILHFLTKFGGLDKS